jgi:glycosyltransferase involved in cell wall biosynthesis
MKILYLCSDPGIPVLGRKGASIHVRALVGALSRTGHQVVLAAQVLNKSPWEIPATVAGNLLQIRPGSNSAATLQALKEFNQTLGVENALPGEVRRILANKELGDELRRRLERDPPDFIYERASLCGLAGVRLAREFKVPLLLELNAPLADEQSAYRGSELAQLAATAERWALTQADAVLVVSKALHEHVGGLGIDSARVHVVPNGVDAAIFRPGPPDAALRERWGVRKGPVLGFVGGLRPWHGIEVLPELLQRLATRHPDAQIVIAGDGPLRRELEAGFVERGLSARALFTGAVPHEEVPGLIRLFDLALAPYPALDHAFYFSPLKLFEYMACGVPVVAARLGQIAEIVTDGGNGLLYSAGDLEALTAACNRLLADSSLRVALGRSAAKSVLTRFTWDHNATRVLEIARQLITLRRGRPR